MFPFISGLDQEQINACFKIINKQREESERKLKIKKERETDEKRLLELKKLMKEFLQNPRLSFKACLYYNYLLTEHNKLKKKLDDSADSSSNKKESESNNMDTTSETKTTNSTEITSDATTDEERGWYNSYLKIF